MLIIVYITIIFLALYAVLIAYYRRGWRELPSFTLHETSNFVPVKVTVIIPARNEEDNIGRCLDSLLAQNYPSGLLEIIIVNDHSTDATEAIIKSYTNRQVKLISLAEHIDSTSFNSYKKKAIEIAIAQSSGELIVTTDADCTAGPDWIRNIVAFQQQHNAVLIAAPVKILPGSRLLTQFQSLDFLILQGITGASVYKKVHSMCNGANLAYSKNVFHEVGGFKGVDAIASGDDMLLMHKIVQRYPQQFFFLKTPAAIVDTLPVTTWKAFLQQRIRWASKSGKYNDWRISLVLLLVYLLNVLLLTVLIMGIFNPWMLLYFGGLIVLKTIIEFSFVHTVAVFFSLQSLMRSFFFFQPLHIIYTVTAGFMGIIGKYEWKGRNVK